MLDMPCFLVSDLVYCRAGAAALLFFLEEGEKASGDHVNKREIIRILHLLIRYCDVDVCSVVPYHSYLKWRRESVDGVLQFALRGYAAQPRQLFEIFQMLIQHDCDLEYRSVAGLTPLLSVLDRANDSGLVSLSNLLLDAEANRLSASTTRQACWVQQILHEFSRAKEFTTLLVTLLRKGCAVSLQSGHGFSPSDLALFPTTWVLWCDALREVGLDVTSVLKEEDIGRGVCYSDSEEIASGYMTSFVKTVREDSIMADSEFICIICNQRENFSGARRPPFEIWRSVLFEQKGTTLARHIAAPAKHLGLNNLSYGTSRNIWTELSWRKLLAYRLWRDGTLSSPSRLKCG